ncbi:MAG: Biopolymer transport protein ExbD/TolR [Candidatus Ozemobacter sibiricus]|jgi:biopolymer transport protein ExbD|uniref:Biopolymer transport protein ExbD/TolR n=1 Tax=Candidatus Ozemobacter sibiricus TaxID=2268124 RepID=A0A367ZQR6_9BACT|nr:MAG: Biopolymer transport protein ExbD/TolR [Candidatus Ozemobacter sibiricus]
MKKLLPERRRERPQIIVTNLIDVILLLVFFFMVTSSFARDTRRLPIDVPRASSGAVIEGETLTFQVNKTGGITLRGEALDLDQVGLRVKEYLAEDPNRGILVEADQGAEYGHVVRVLDAIRTAGGTAIGLSTRIQ